MAPSRTFRTFELFAALCCLVLGCSALDNGLARTPQMGWAPWCAAMPHLVMLPPILEQTGQPVAQEHFRRSQ